MPRRLEKRKAVSPYGMLSPKIVFYRHDSPRSRQRRIPPRDPEFRGSRSPPSEQPSAVQSPAWSGVAGPRLQTNRIHPFRFVPIHSCRSRGAIRKPYGKHFGCGGAALGDLRSIIRGLRERLLPTFYLHSPRRAASATSALHHPCRSVVAPPRSLSGARNPSPALPSLPWATTHRFHESGPQVRNITSSRPNILTASHSAKPA